MAKWIWQALVATTALTAASPALAQQTQPTTGTSAAAADNGTQVEEITVTAQKREERLQDVPVAVTAITSQTLQANRIVNVVDLNALAPGLQVVTAAGGIGLPNIIMRGESSYGVAPGSDKQVALYIDGAYYGAPRGEIFDIADIERIETLRGPQGTLFGRSATAGAISIITPNPTGEFGLREMVSVGDHNLRRSYTHLELPEFNTLSGYVAFVHEEKDGDIDNLGAGTHYHFSSPIPDEHQNSTSPSTLGAKDLNSVLAALAWNPTNNFNVTYKYDYSENHGTPEAFVPIYRGPFGAAFTGTFYPDRRPDAVNNYFTTYDHTINWGHNLTANWEVNENLSLKNIFSNRHSYNFSQQQADGGALAQVVLPGPTVLSLPYQGLLNQAYSNNWGDEAQLNYHLDRLEVTAGLSYYSGHDESGPPPGYCSTYGASGSAGSNCQSPITNGAINDITTFNPAYAGWHNQISKNQSTSEAAYLQAEYHLNDQLVLVGGFRETRDHKQGTFTTNDFDGLGGLPPGANNTGTVGFHLTDGTPTYLAGINYTPVQDILLYAKYSTGFVSGGAAGTVAWLPEHVESTEVGVKADWFDHRLRTNLAIYEADYTNLQSPFSGGPLGHPELSVVVENGGDARARGAELEVTGRISHGFTVGGSFSYLDLSQTRQDPTLTLYGQNPLAGRSKVTASLYADYVTAPLFAEATLHLRSDAIYESDKNFNSFLEPNGFGVPAPGDAAVAPAHWTVNGRVALENIQVDGATFDVALWGRNLFNDDSLNYVGYQAYQFASVSFVPERAFGLDLTFRY